MNLAVVGLSYKTTPVEIREKLSISEAKLEQAIAHLCAYPHIEEVAILSTCNRLEIYMVVLEMDQAIREVTEFLVQQGQLPFHQLDQHLFILRHQDVLRHLMQVASGLDSLVLGEGQILAQVKHTYKLGQQYNGIKCLLNQLFKHAITAAKRVRTETKIGAGAVSISSAAVELAQLKVANLSTCQVTIVGAGKMARRLVQHLLAKGVTQISIVNRSLEGAKVFASQFSEANFSCYSLAEMMSVIAKSDIVFTSTAATKPLVNRAKLAAVLAPNQPLMLFDISVPRNVDADVNQLDQIQVFNVDDLQTVVTQNQDYRQQMAIEAQRLIEAEIEAFSAWWRSRETVSTISCLRKKAETIREQELEKALSRLGSEFGKKHQEVIEALTRGIVNKLLHEPMVQLRTQPDLEAQRLAISTLQVLFNLEPGNSNYTSVAQVPYSR